MRFQNLNKNCALLMKAVPERQICAKLQEKIASTPEASKLFHTPKTHAITIIPKQDSESQSGEDQKDKGSMENLCQLFLEKVASKELKRFEAKDLQEEIPIQQRRIYDLMNILEGCGFVKRICKGTYEWKGFEAEDFKSSNEKSRKEATSLSSLARRIKEMLVESPDSIDFKDICSVILGQNVEASLKPESIKRRVYECCKVLKMLGRIEKKGHAFRWAKNTTLRSFQAKKIKKQGMEIKARSKIEPVPRLVTEHSKSTLFQLSNTVLTHIQCEQELNSFIEHLKDSFYKRGEIAQPVGRSLRYE